MGHKFTNLLKFTDTKSRECTWMKFYEQLETLKTTEKYKQTYEHKIEFSNEDVFSNTNNFGRLGCDYV